MTTFMKTKARLCANSLMITRSEFKGEHRYDSDNGKKYNSFGYIEKGSVVMSSVSGEVRAGEGDLIYVPEGMRYFSIWKGSEDTDSIIFYSIHFQTEITDFPFWKNLDFQRIDSLSGGVCGERIRRLAELCGGSFSDQLLAYSLFYQTAAEAVPEMKNRFSGELPEVLRTAVRYIDDNFSSLTSIAEIAGACYISESRLYHLFREYLNTTPVTYINRIKILQATELMRSTDSTLQEIASALNFNSEYYFRKTFRQVTGENPSVFRKQRK